MINKNKKRKRKAFVVNGIKRNNPEAYEKPAPKKRPVGRPKGTTKNDIKITEKEQLFANLVLENLLKTRGHKMSNTDCYRLAYQSYKMKDASAQVTASKILNRPRVYAYIQQRKKAAAGRVEITTARVLRGLLRIAEFDPRRLLDKKGRPVPIHKLDDDTALGMAGLEFDRISKRTPSGRRKIIMLPKRIKHEARKPAWELLGHHLNMFAGAGNENTPEDFVQEIREFADTIAQGVPGGKI